MSVKATGTGPTTLRTYTFPDYDASILTSVAALLPYTIGDLIYPSTTTSLAKLAAVAVGQVLVSGGVATAPAWSATPTVTDLTLSGVLKIGTNPATVGAIRLATGSANGIQIRNTANTSNYNALYVGTDDLFHMDGIVKISGLVSPTMQGSSGEWMLGFSGGSFYVNDSSSPLVLRGAGVTFEATYVQGAEITAPAAPAANGGRLYFDDNGSGKTRLMVIFNTGAAQQIAIQP